MVLNQHLIGRINSTIVVAAYKTPDDILDTRYEIYSHDNILVFKKNCFVFDSVYGHTVDVAPFEPLLVLCN